ncbi:MAG: DUF3795 domain-containing protein [Candidatus Moranbacteria bacterium]|nr:DUF3795 domain-containing protein [Candidatus Moranbacteria bacterium]
MKLKEHETIGCCGIDCGLCPRFHTKGDSACPGCGGLNFKEKHPSCGFLTCCVIKNGLEICSDCNDYPCKRFDSEIDGYDSFVTHKKIFANLDNIKLNGIKQFIENQGKRIEILDNLLTKFDDGRSKSFYCVGCALLPLDQLQEVHRFACNLNNAIENKEKCKQTKLYMTKMADSLNLDLRLNKKKKFT